MKKANETEKKKGYPIMPYLIGLFITVIALVVLSYLMQMRNKQELINHVDNNIEISCNYLVYEI